MRVKILYVHPEIIADLVRQGSIVQCVAEQIPIDAIIYDKGYDLITGRFYITLLSESFDDIPNGARIPEIWPVLHKIATTRRKDETLVVDSEE